jgi:transaldolase
MKIFIDSADIAEIKEAASLGVLDGCTTNPSLLAKVGRKIESAIPEICEIVDGPVSAEVVATAHDEMVAEGRKLAKLHKNVVVKVPLLPDGIRAVKTLLKDGVRCNVTLCFSAPQAMLAAKVGAMFISPFLGRIDDAGAEGMELIQQIMNIYSNYDFETKVLAASIRHPVHVLQAASLGAHCATMPLSVIKQLYKHPLTDVGLEKFLADAKKAQQNAK